jgi:hypothetical protein
MYFYWSIYNHLEPNIPTHIAGKIVPIHENMDSSVEHQANPKLSSMITLQNSFLLRAIPIPMLFLNYHENNDSVMIPVQKYYILLLQYQNHSVKELRKLAEIKNVKGPENYSFGSSLVHQNQVLKATFLCEI